MLKQARIFIAMAILSVFCLASFAQAAPRTMEIPPAGITGKEALADIMIKDPEFASIFLRKLMDQQQAAIKAGPMGPRSNQAGMLPGGTSGMTADSGLGAKPAPEMKAPKTPLTVGANVEIYSSLTCPYCWTLWDDMRKYPVIRKDMERTGFRVKFLVENDRTAMPIIIYESLMGMDRNKAYEFIDFLSKNRALIRTGNDMELPVKLDGWLKDNGYGSLAEFSKTFDHALIQTTLESYIQEFKDRGLRGTPTIMVNGVENDKYLEELSTGK